MSDSRGSSGYAQVNASAAPRNLEGAAWMLVSAVGFTIHVVLAKLLSADVHPIYIAFLRSLLAFAIAAPLLVSGHVKLSTYRFELVFTRSVFGSIGFIFSMLAVWEIYNLPFAEFNALSFTRSLFVTIFAAIILRETVGLLRWGAVLVGFLGVLIMAVPGVVFFWTDIGAAPTLSLGSLFAILSAICFAVAIVLVKSLTQHHKPIELLIWANLLSTGMLLTFILVANALSFAPGLSWMGIPWAAPSAKVWGMLGLMALTGLGAQFCYIKAMSIGDASFLSPMDYLRLPMAVVADWWLIKTFPGIFTWIGAGIIIAATLFITVRERMKKAKV